MPTTIPKLQNITTRRRPVISHMWGPGKGGVYVDQPYIMKAELLDKNT